MEGHLPEPSELARSIRANVDLLRAAREAGEKGRPVTLPALAKKKLGRFLHAGIVENYMAEEYARPEQVPKLCALLEKHRARPRRASAMGACRPRT